MKKNYFILVILLIMVVGYAATQMKIDIKGNTILSENTSDFNVYLANLKLNGTEIEGINVTKDGYEINVPSKGTLEYDVINDSTEYDVEATVECEEETGANEVTNFDYTGGEQTFVAPVTGVYKLETWGAQGGSSTIAQGGYGSYSVGNVLLNKDDKLYINIGGAGLYRKVNQSPYTITGGYNGGGTAYDSSEKENRSSGGGATHIATISGQLSSLSSSVGKIMIVSGGGGGSTGSAGGAAGGIKGVMGAPISGYTIGTGGTQTSGGVCSNSNKYSCTSSLNGSFGKGGNSIRSSDNTTYGGSGGGGGFYGGAAGYDNGAGSGGSGYIGNSSLTEKTMYCYNCQESKDESTKTISTTCVNSTPTENCAKSGNGYARITQISPIVSSIQLETTTLEAQDKVNKSVEVSNNGMKCSLKIKKISRAEKKEKYSGPTEWTFDYTGEEQTFTVPVSGTYKLETWGAQGGINSTLSNNSLSKFSYGGYASGIINLKKDTDFFIFIGQAGNNLRTNIFNGGGIGGLSDQNSFGQSGGGATDIRIDNNVWNNFSSLKSRIMVAAGGGGSADGVYTNGGQGSYAGGLSGYNGGYYPGHNYVNQDGKGATQKSGGAAGANIFGATGTVNKGAFGYGGSSYSTSSGIGSGGGGSGYYGGGAGGGTLSGGNGQGGGGGSSFISGHNGCDAISEESTATNIIHTGQSVHYSGYKFTDTIMIDGTGCKWTNEKTTVCDGMPSHDGTSTIQGNTGNGYARITLIK